MQPDIDAAYNKLPLEAKGLFAQNVIAAMLKHQHRAADLKQELDSRLARIGWTVSDDVKLETQDALVSEAFFPPGSAHDVYVAIRDILATAQSQIIVVDGYIGTSLFQTLKAIAHRPTLRVNILTVARQLPGDFPTELATFRAQHGHFTVEVRGTGDFHDRFIAIDDTKFYHVGASIKDAGRKVFMISRIEDKPNIDHARTTIGASWSAATRIH